MKKVGWVRYGRDDCEGYSLELASLVRLSISRSIGAGPERWTVNLNAIKQGEAGSFDDAIKLAERTVRMELEPAWIEWQTYQHGPRPTRRSGKRRR